jgi:hypothetical protein
VAFGRDVVPQSANSAVLADPERHAHDAEERFAEEGFHAPRAVGLDDFEFRVGEQREIQLVLGLELRLCFNGVAATTDDRGIQLLELVGGVAKLGRFIRSTGRVGFREEIENQILSTKIGE